MAVLAIGCSGVVPSDSRDAGGCRLGTPIHVLPAPSLEGAQARGLTTDGGVLYIRGKPPDGPYELWLSPQAGAAAALIRRSDRGTQILDFTGNERWVIWREERAADLQIQDWSIWAYDRATGATVDVGERALTADGYLMPTPEVRPSLYGGTVAWSATASVSQTGEPNVVAYLAELPARAAIVARGAAWASAIGDDEIEFIEDSRKGNGSKTPQLVTLKATRRIAQPLTGDRGDLDVVIHAASSTVSVIATADDRVMHRSRTTDAETVSNERGAWLVAGDRASAWITDNDTRVLVDGEAKPQTVASVPGQNDVFAAGSWIGWVSAATRDGVEVSRAAVTCR